MADDHPYNKRKYDDPPSPAPATRRPTGFSAPIVAGPDDDGIQLAKQRAQEIAARLFSAAEAKRPKVENGGGGDDYGDKGFGSVASEHPQKPLGQQIPALTSHSSYSSFGYSGSTKKIEIPNGRVGVIIGKGGETIKYLQLQSGAKIQVTRDMDADPNSQSRMVELVGSYEQISKAEQLINDVLAEADSGGGSARKAGSVQVQHGAGKFSMPIPNNKVGLIIGKGGENIKSMQAKSGARIQVVPLHLPPGDTSTERTLYIDGTDEQIESAKLLVDEVISENRVRNPTAGGYPSQSYRPPHQPSWGPPGMPPMQQQGYGYMQPGAYPGAPPPYNTLQQAYGAYPPPAAGGYSSTWDQTTNQPTQPPAPGGGYDYYSQQQQSQQQTAGGSTASDGTNYNYGQPPSYTNQGSYGDKAYSQTTAGQQPGYGYATASQPGYGQPVPNPSSYDQQGYGSTPGYVTSANPTQDGSAPSHGTPSGSSQAPTPVPGQQAPSQQGYSNQPPVASSAGYATPAAAPTGYASSPYGSTPAQAAYGQSAPPAQPNYGQPPQVQKPPAQAAYGQGQPPAPAQSGYMQPAPAATGYGQAPQPQPGYAQDSTYRPPSSYGQQSYGVPPPGQPGYGQQQSYADSYGSGAYSQPSTYSSDSAAHPSYDAPAAAPTASAGATKASPT